MTSCGTGMSKPLSVHNLSRDSEAMLKRRGQSGEYYSKIQHPAAVDTAMHTVIFVAMLLLDVIIIIFLSLVT